MGRLGSAGVMGLVLVVAALAPVAAAGDPLTECTTVRYAITPQTGGSYTVCPPGGPDPDPDVGVEQYVGGLPIVGPLIGDPYVSAFSCTRQGDGVELDVSGKPSFVCVSYTLIVPSDIGLPGFSPEADVIACHPTEYGLGATVLGSKAKVCSTLDIATPQDFGSANPSVDTKSCTAPSGGGADPSVGAFGGGVAVCVVPMVMIGQPSPGQPPPVGVDTEPCSAAGFDPAITVGNGGFFFCVEAQVDP